jgi:hypothetical protein
MRSIELIWGSVRRVRMRAPIAAALALVVTTVGSEAL